MNTHFTCWRLMASYVASFLHSFKESIERVWFLKCRIRVRARGKIQCLNYNTSLCTALFLLHEMIFLKRSVIHWYLRLSLPRVCLSRVHINFDQKIFFLFSSECQNQKIQHEIWQIPGELIFGWVHQFIQQHLKRSNIY